MSFKVHFITGIFSASFIKITGKRYWTKEFTIRYQSGNSNFVDYKNPSGEKITFTANYDMKTPVTNTFPSTLVTKSIRVYPTKWNQGSPALRVEFIGCRDQCLSSLGAAQNPPYGVAKLSDEAFTSSSSVPGFPPSNGRLFYNEQTFQGTRGGKNTITAYNEKLNWDAAKSKCISKAIGNGALVSIDSKDTNDLIENKIRNLGEVEDGTCYWIGLARVNGQFEWDDGTQLDFQNWADGENQQNKCVCMSPEKGYKWITLDCLQEKPHVCEKYVPSDVWIASANDNQQWLQVDLGDIISVNGVLLQGNPDESTTDYVTKFQVSYSSNGEDFVVYQEPNALFPNGYYPTFIGNTDPSLIQSAFFQHPITARYVRILPKAWVGRIALRVDIVGCPDHDHMDCKSTGDYVFQTAGDDQHFTISCPAGCSSSEFEPMNVVGTTQYSMDSSVCQAAIHDGRLFGETGGVITGYRSTSSANGFSASVQHGIQSTERVTNAPQDAFIFQGDHLGCDDGWRMFREHCYYVPRTEEDLNWYDARSKCQSKDADLVTLKDKAEQDFVFNALQDAKVNKYVWIGLTDKGHHNYYDQYIDGTPVTFTNWDFKEPNSQATEDEQCVVMIRTNGMWDDSRCTKADRNYVCKKQKTPQNHAQIDPENEGCPKGWKGRENKCYKLYNDPQYWGKARKACKGQGATLATVHDSATNAFLHSMIAEETLDSHNYWIGLYADISDPDNHALDQGLIYLWDSKEEVDFTDPWAPGEPDTSTHCANPFTFHGQKYEECINKGTPGVLLGSEDEPGYWCGLTEDGRKWMPCDTTGNYKHSCALMRKSDGKWHYPMGDDENRGCFEYANYICETMKDGEVRPTPTKPPTVDEPCDESKGWFGWSGSKKCYKFDYYSSAEDGDASFDFSLADATCRQMADGGKSHLVSIHNQNDENNLVKLLLEKSKDTVFWIGLSEPEGQKGYGWTDGSALNYLNWGIGEPNNHNGMENCVELKIRDGQSWWNDNFCWASNHFVCAVDRGVEGKVQNIVESTYILT